VSLLGKLVLSIVGDTSGLDRSLSGAEKSLLDTSKRWQQIGKKITSVGIGMSAAVTAPLVLIGKKSLDMAMEAVESENLFEVSMEGMADSARKWSVKLRNELGLNEYEVRKNVATFNVMFDSMGIGTDSAYDMATGLTQLAYDMSSFYNLEPHIAFEKLQAGITGEIEPLKRLGILVSENTVKQWAYNNALAKPGEELTEQEKVLARYGTIMDQTAKAQGDLARTIDSPTNQLRIFKEQINLLMVDIGQQLIPVFSDVIDILKPMVESFSELSDGSKSFVVKLGLILAVGGPVILIIGQMADAISILATSFHTLNTAVTGGVAARAFTTLATGAATLAEPLGGLALLFHSNEVAMGNIEGLSEKVNSEFSLMQKIVPVVADRYDDLVTYGLQPALHQLSLMDGKMPGIMEHARELAQSYLEGKISLEELVGLLEQYAGSMGDLIEKNPMLAVRILETEAAQRELKNATQEATEATGEATTALEEEAAAAEAVKLTIDELINSIFSYYNLNQSATEAAWKYQEALAAAAEVSQDSQSSDKDKQKAVFEVQDALEGLLLAMAAEYEATETSIARKKELQAQFDEVARKAIEDGMLTETAFDQMAATFTVDKDSIALDADQLKGKLEEMTEPKTIEIGFWEDTSARSAIEKNIASIPTDITVKVKYGSGTVPGLQHGGIIESAGFVDVGERGRERIFLPQGAVVKPLNYGGMDVSGDININISGDGAGIDTELFSEFISGKLIETIKQEGARR
jgi:hypothetical protein